VSDAPVVPDDGDRARLPFPARLGGILGSRTLRDRNQKCQESIGKHGDFLPFLRDVTSAKGNGDPGGRITLPFRFDTSPVVRLILRGVLALLLLVIVPGLLYSLLVSHRVVVAVQLGIIGLIAAYFGWLLLRNLSATRGRDEVVLGTLPTSG
jgi:hypothetical protein